MNKRLILSVLAAACLLVGSVPAVLAQEDACFQKGGTWDATQQKCVITAIIEITIDYPLALAQYDFAAQAIDQFMTDQRAAFLGPLSEYGFFPSPGPLTLMIDYEQFQFSPGVVSLKFTISDYTGGAHPNSFFQTFVFDLDQQRVLTLSDLFQPGADPLAVIAPIVQQSLQTQLGEMADLNWIQEGTGNTLENYQTFVVATDALIFFFPPYQVAAYAAGPQIVSIPLAQLGAILAPPFNGAN